MKHTLENGITVSTVSLNPRVWETMVFHANGQTLWEKRNKSKAAAKAFHQKCMEKYSTTELHTCPYREEVHGDYQTLCECDEIGTQQCCEDV